MVGGLIGDGVERPGQVVAGAVQGRRAGRADVETMLLGAGRRVRLLVAGVTPPVRGDIEIELAGRAHDQRRAGRHRDRTLGRRPAARLAGMDAGEQRSAACRYSRAASPRRRRGNSAGIRRPASRTPPRCVSSARRRRRRKSRSQAMSTRRAQRVRVARRQARRRPAGLECARRLQRALDMGVPQRERIGIRSAPPRACRRSRSPGDGARRCRDRAGASASRNAGKRRKTSGAQRGKRHARKADQQTQRAPSGGSQSHSPSQDAARNRPIAVASAASAGHSRSQKIVTRARRTAASSTVRAAVSRSRGAVRAEARLGRRQFGHNSSVICGHPRRHLCLRTH